MPNPSELTRAASEPQAAPKPKPGESEEDFMARCEDSGASTGTCETQWEDYGDARGPANYPRISQAFFGSAWALMPEKYQEIAAFIRAKRDGIETPFERLATAHAGAVVDPQAKQRGNYSQIVGKVGVLDLFGVLSQRMDMMTQISGGTSTQRFGQEFDSLMADKMVRSILLVIDSPGGSVFGTQELAQKIFDARGQKKVVAVADALAASAAYWIGCQAAEFYVTPSGQVGSIGVVASHQDTSKADEAAGIKETLIHAGKYKTEGSPTQPLSAEGAETIQTMVNGYYASFVKAVSRGRGVSEAAVEKSYGQGRMKAAADARAVGMVDGIATVETVLARMNGTTAAAAMARARALELEVGG